MRDRARAAETEDDASESGAPRIQLSGGIKLRLTANRPLSHASSAYPGQVRGSNFVVILVPRRGGGASSATCVSRVGGFAVFTVAMRRDAAASPGKLSYGGIESSSRARETTGCVRQRG